MSVLVAGAGISGLVAAFELSQAGVPVTLADAATRVGGKISTEHIDGFLIEGGPDSFLVQNPAVVELCDRLDLAGDLVGARSPADVFVWRNGLVPVPEGAAFGIPRSVRSFARSELFSVREKARIIAELVIPPSQSDGDESIGAFMRRRFGTSLVERLAGPILEGVYGAPVDELSLLALVPRFRDIEQRYGSVLRAELERRRRRRTAERAPMLTLSGGVGSLVDALRRRLAAVDLRLGVALKRIERGGGGHVAHFANGSRERFEAIIIATPAGEAARILADAAPAASRALAAIPHGSTTVVSLAYRDDQLGRALDGHGFLAARGTLDISACTWSSSKWPGRAPAGHVLLRASVRDEARGRADAELIAMVRAAFAFTLGANGAPELARVTRHAGVMPRYVVGHLARVRSAEAALAELPGVDVIGAAYHGVGLPECVTAAIRAAGRVQSLGHRRVRNDAEPVGPHDPDEVGELADPARLRVRS